MVTFGLSVQGVAFHSWNKNGIMQKKSRKRPRTIREVIAEIEGLRSIQDEKHEFEKSSTAQLDDFMNKLMQFQINYGFAVKPFAYLAHPKDAWALRIQITLSAPVVTEVKMVNGILLIESADIKEGESIFVRK